MSKFYYAIYTSEDYEKFIYRCKTHQDRKDFIALIKERRKTKILPLNAKSISIERLEKEFGKMAYEIVDGGEEALVFGKNFVRYITRYDDGSICW